MNKLKTLKLGDIFTTSGHTYKLISFNMKAKSCYNQISYRNIESQVMKNYCQAYNSENGFGSCPLNTKWTYEKNWINKLNYNEYAWLLSRGYKIGEIND